MHEYIASNPDYPRVYLRRGFYCAAGVITPHDIRKLQWSNELKGDRKSREHDQSAPDIAE